MKELTNAEKKPPVLRASLKFLELRHGDREFIDRVGLQVRRFEGENRRFHNILASGVDRDQLAGSGP